MYVRMYACMYVCTVAQYVLGPLKLPVRLMVFGLASKWPYSTPPSPLCACSVLHYRFVDWGEGNAANDGPGQ